MIGVIDESTPWFRPDRSVVLYTIALVIIDDQSGPSARLQAGLNRRRPFHWESDPGTNVRAVLVDELCASVRVVVAARPCHPADQTAVRRQLLETVVLGLAYDIGVNGLVFERQSRAENERDVRTVRDWARAGRRAWRPTIEHVGKDQPTTWLADAAAGIWSDVLLGRPSGHLERVAANGVLRSATFEP